MQLNGKNYPATFINHTEIEKGGSLVFTMSSQPNYQRGIYENEMSISSVDDKGFTAVPYFEMQSNKIKNSLPVIIKQVEKDAAIYYSIQPEGQKAGSFMQYKKPFVLTIAATVKVYAVKNNFKSPVVSQQFYKVVTDRTITVKSKVHPMYTAGGSDALIDGITGTINWKTGEWQSYFDKDFEAVIDFKKPRAISYAGIHVLQEVGPWIIYPKEVLFEISTDGKNFRPLVTVSNKVSNQEKGPVLQELGAAVKATARFVKIKAINGGSLPAWHESAGQPSHLFIDEVMIH